jgi:hypothetical protein
MLRLLAKLLFRALNARLIDYSPSGPRLPHFSIPFATLIAQSPLTPISAFIISKFILLLTPGGLQPLKKPSSRQAQHERKNTDHL